MAEKDRELKNLREQIADLDRQLVKALDARAKLSRDVRRLVEGDPRAADASDQSYLETVLTESSGELREESLRAIFSQIAAAARSIEMPARVAFVGPEGNFCHQMVKGHFGVGASFVEASTVSDALEQVVRERATYAVFAFDSSVDGLILPAIAALAETDLVLVAERTLPAVVSVMRAPGASGDPKTLYATPTAHAMCELFVQRRYPGAKAIDGRSPVDAGQLAAKDEESVALLPEATGNDLGLELIEHGVGDEPDLKYRFGIVGTRPTSRTGNDTTCLLFSLDDVPGTLFQVLSHFAERGINLKKIQSRPVRGASWDYIFYVEVAGHATDRPLVTALDAVKGSTRYLKLLGSFPTEE